ncbi:SDR family oxidoreductase [Desulfovibrio sp. OttesenSCG-928-C14]|nr:SDR family oxidoreductase [Desulfovibrio sp. OttesenSCG-928-C14]
MDFSGKTAIVTGATGGIGKAVAEGIIRGGGTVALAGINAPALEATRLDLGERSSAYVLDLGDAPGTRAAFAQIINDLKKIDILVNSGGLVSSASFEEISDAEWENVLRVNLTGTFTACSAIFGHMRENGGGSIVNIASVAAKLGGGLLGTAAYASSKAGVIGLSKAIAREGGPFGIRCNAVCPSYTLTPMTKSITNDPAFTERVLRMIPLGRAASPEEIANMVLFFASDLASFITGEIGDADGGLTRDG